MIYRRLREGDRTGEYILGSLKDRDEFVETWQAEHHLLHRKVTVIVAVDERGLPGLKAMGIAQHSLDHPGVQRTVGLNLDKNPPYLVLAAIEGRSLREVIVAEAPLPWNRVADLMSALLDGLNYAHSQDRIHGNLRPENVILTLEGSPVMTGFGGRAAATTSDDFISDSLGEEEIEAVEEAVYFPRDPDPLSPAFDVYSVGVILFELLTGARPAGSEVPGDMVDGIPDGVNDLFRKAYTGINLRYPDTRAMIDAIGDLKGVETLLSPPSVPSDGIQFIRSVRTCGKCGSENRLEFTFCTVCGTSFDAPEAVGCRICGKTLAGNGCFCTFCGAAQ
jgi:serine/threonine protein kinase